MSLPNGVALRLRDGSVAVWDDSMRLGRLSPRAWFGPSTRAMGVLASTWIGRRDGRRIVETRVRLAPPLVLVAWTVSLLLSWGLTPLVGIMLVPFAVWGVATWTVLDEHPVLVRKAVGA